MTSDPDDSEQTWRQRPLRGGAASPEPAREGGAATGHLFAALRRFFEDEEWKFVEMEGQSALRLGCTGENGEWTCYAQIREEPGRFIFYSVPSVKVPGARRAVAAEFITRVNYGMVLGNFEMDYGDGEIRYKTSAYLEEIEPTRDFFHTLVYTNLLVTDKYLPGIMSIIYAGVSAEQAIGQIGP